MWFFAGRDWQQNGQLEIAALPDLGIVSAQGRSGKFGYANTFNCAEPGRLYEVSGRSCFGGPTW